MTIASVDRTATAAWCPVIVPDLDSGNADSQSPSSPLYIALGSVAGALDSSFSTNSTLEIFSLLNDRFVRVGGISSSARFNRLAWTHHLKPQSAPMGWILGGLESGEVSAWSAKDVVLGTEQPAFSHAAHSTAVKGLDVNTIQTNLYGSGAGEGELYIWDLNNPGSPFTPGSSLKAPKLVGSNVSDLRWNRNVPYIIGSASSNGVVMVWDLRNRREVMSLNAASAQAGGGFGQGVAPWQGGGMGGARRSSTVLAWNPDIATQLMTATDDDMNPALMVWDLRNAHAPERVIPAHSKGMLNISWCPKDGDMIASCGKDNRTVIWNTTTGEYVGELPPAQNWVFDVQWCQRDPDKIATASFDGKICITSLQSPIVRSSEALGDMFGATGQQFHTGQQEQHVRRILEKPPKWLRRPCGASFGFGAMLTSFQHIRGSPNLQGSHGNQQGVNTGNSAVQVRSLPAIPELKARSEAFDTAVAAGPSGLTSWCQERLRDPPLCKEKEPASNIMWGAIPILLDDTNGRLRLVQLLEPFKYKRVAPFQDQSTEEAKKQDESESQRNGPNVDVPGLNPFSAREVSENPFDNHDDVHNASLQPKAQNNELDVQFSNLNLNAHAPVDEPEGPTTTFRLFSQSLFDGESLEGDLRASITEAVLKADYEQAVELCISGNLWSDAIMLANLGGEGIYESTRDAYLIHRIKLGEEDADAVIPTTTTLGYSFYRLLSDIVLGEGNLEDVVERTPIDEWVHATTAVVTYAKGDELRELCGRIGRRLMEAWQQRTSSRDDASKDESAGQTQSFITTDMLLHFAAAVLLVAADLENVVYLWYLDMVDSQSRLLGSDSHGEQQRCVVKTWARQFEVRATLLQDFVERAATVQSSLGVEENEDETGSRLSLLYTHYVEFAEFLCQQGLLQMAWRQLQLLPSGAETKVGTEKAPWAQSAKVLRDRLFPRIRTLEGLSDGQRPNAPFNVAPLMDQPNTGQGYEQNPAYSSGQPNQIDHDHPSQSYAPQPAYGAPTQPPHGGQGQVQPGANPFNPQTPPVATHGNFPQSYGQAQAVGGHNQVGYPNQFSSQSLTNTPQSLPPTPNANRSFPPAVSGLAAAQLPNQGSGGISHGYGNQQTQPYNASQPRSQRSGSLSIQPPVAGISSIPPPLTNVPTASQPPTSIAQATGGWNDAPIILNSTASSRRGSHRAMTSPRHQQSRISTAQYPGQQAVVYGQTQMQQAGPIIGQQQGALSPLPQSTQFAPPPAPAKQRLPPGDRSHIPHQQLASIQSLENVLAQYMHNPAWASQSRMLEDISKRLNSLADALNNSEVNPEQVQHVDMFAQALSQNDINTAHHYHQLLSSSSAVAGGDAAGRMTWSIGLKRLLDLRSRG